MFSYHHAANFTLASLFDKQKHRCLCKASLQALFYFAFYFEKFHTNAILYKNYSCFAKQIAFVLNTNLRLLLASLSIFVEFNIGYLSTYASGEKLPCLVKPI